MHTKDYSRLLAELGDAYAQHSPRSAKLQQQAKRVLVDGGSHTLRLNRPFPPYIVDAQGVWFTDEDGHRIMDLWQGHLANILGHNPEVITAELSRALDHRWGLQTGMPDRLQVEVAEILCRQTGAEQVRFTTSGSLATMYAVILARAYTGRELVLKVGGGWHGGHPWGLKGVGFYQDGFQHVESEGLSTNLTDGVIVTTFNEPQMLREHLRQYGDRLACFIVEPFVGAGGLIAAKAEYLRTARELAHEYGVLLIFDEVIAGFRFRAGDTGRLYGVQPDLITLGKIIGGGMPVAAVGGRQEIMRLVGYEDGPRVKFSGGTYSAHPASLLAAKAMLTYLIAHEAEVYPYVARLGEQARQAMEAAFIAEGIYARCTGYGNEIVGGSATAFVRFPHDPQTELDKPDALFDPAVCDVALSDQVLRLALLLEAVHLVRGHGLMTTAHTEADVEFLGQACACVARRVKSHL